MQPIIIVPKYEPLKSLIFAVALSVIWSGAYWLVLRQNNLRAQDLLLVKASAICTGGILLMLIMCIIKGKPTAFIADQNGVLAACGGAKKYRFIIPWKRIDNIEWKTWISEEKYIIFNLNTPLDFSAAPVLLRFASRINEMMNNNLTWGEELHFYSGKQLTKLVNALEKLGISYRGAGMPR